MSILANIFKWFGKRNAVYDKIEIDKEKEDKKKDKNYEPVSEIYRKLCMNYERNLRFGSRKF